jgi:hypothetical protein
MFHGDFSPASSIVHAASACCVDESANQDSVLDPHVPHSEPRDFLFVGKCFVDASRHKRRSRGDSPAGFGPPVRIARRADTIFSSRMAGVGASFDSYASYRRILDGRSLVSFLRYSFLPHSLFPNRPNKALEPTPPSVTSRAYARAAPAGVVAHL